MMSPFERLAKAVSNDIYRREHGDYDAFDYVHDQQWSASKIKSILRKEMGNGDWLDRVITETAEAESPTSFIYWSALAAVSAVVNNKVYLQKGGIYKLYPNVYVMLVAKSGLRKGYPVAFSKALVQEVNNTRIISGRSSVQAIIKELSQSKAVPGGGIIKDSIGYINSGEFSTALVRDEDSLTILTDLFDGHYNPSWNNTLKGSGKEELKNVNITLLGAFNQTHFNTMISQKELTGGFVARCITVLEHKRSHKNDLLDDDTVPVDTKGLAEYLKGLTKLEGKFRLEVDAKAMFRKWYKSFEPEESDDTTGTLNRIHDTILKVSMLISLARGGELVIRKTYLEEAFEKVMQTVQSITQITAGSGIDVDFSAKLRVVLNELIQATGFTLTRAEILGKHYGDFDKFTLDKIIDTIYDAKGLEYKMIGSDMHYTLTEKAVNAIRGSSRLRVAK